VVSRLLGRRCYAQSSINAYYEPPEFLFADRYAYMLKIAAMVLVFAPAVTLTPTLNPNPNPNPSCPPRCTDAACADVPAGPMLRPRAPSLRACAPRCHCSTGWAA